MQKCKQMILSLVAAVVLGLGTAVQPVQADDAEFVPDLVPGAPFHLVAALGCDTPFLLLGCLVDD